MDTWGVTKVWGSNGEIQCRMRVSNFQLCSLVNLVALDKDTKVLIIKRIVDKLLFW